MYVTRPLSMYNQSPSALSLPPPEGPNSGILVIQDEESEPTCCFGKLKTHRLKELPFPQNKILVIRYSTGVGNNQRSYHDDVVLIPVLDQPLSSNRYYALEPHGKHKGEAFTNSNEDDIVTCCFCNFVSDAKPQPFDPMNIYQQVEIRRRDYGGFSGKSVAPDGFPPEFLRRKGWEVYTKTPRNFFLDEAPGLDSTLRSRLPDINFPLSEKSSKPVVVGKWYCPFMFIKEATPRDQMSGSMFYEMTLEQSWERVFSCENNYNEDNVAVVDVGFKTEVVSIGGVKSLNEGKKMDVNVVDGVMWFRSFSSDVGSGDVSVGLSLEITERMKWEEERFGWVRGEDGEVSVKKVEEFGGVGEWNRFGFYVLVERFVLRRMDRSFVLGYGFRHSNRVRNEWE